jgi:hypothetical protein
LMMDSIVAMQVLDRVFDGDDVRGPRVVDVVDHRRQRRALAAARGAGDEHQAAFLGGDLLEHRRQPSSSTDLMVTGMTRRTMPMVPRCWNTLQRKRPSPAIAVGEIDFLGVPELLALGSRHDGGGHLDEIIVIELLVAATRRQPAVDAGHRVAADLEVQVGGADVRRRFKQRVDMHGGSWRPDLAATAAGPPASANGAHRAVRRVMMPKNRSWRRGDRAALAPLPTGILSIDRMGVTSTAVPQKKASSASRGTRAASVARAPRSQGRWSAGSRCCG